MAVMGLEAIYQRPKCSVTNPEHKIFPYLLRHQKIDHVNQVWSTDITYIPMKRGFLYLCAVVDWYSRFILSWELSNTLTVDFCVRSLTSACHRWGKPSIFNTDQGSQFTSSLFIRELEQRQVLISMDGRGRALDNIFIERFWRTLKYEHIYLREYVDGRALAQGLSEYMQFYNYERKHQSLSYLTPNQVYNQGIHPTSNNAKSASRISTLTKL